MTKFLIGVATAALWFALSHAANAERVCRQVCDSGTCVSRCIQRSDSEAVIRDREQPAASPTTLMPARQSAMS